MVGTRLGLRQNTSLAHLAGIASGLALVTLSYFAFYAGRVDNPDRDSKRLYYAIAATDNLQVWRIGATKALDRDADVRLIYTTEQACKSTAHNGIATAEVRPVVHLAQGSFLQPGQILLSAIETTISQLCDNAGANRYAFWSTDSRDLKIDLERLGQTPAYYAAGQ